MLDHGIRTHHSNMDDYDRVIPADIMQASAIVASLAWHAANREDLFPRKVLPEPVAPRGSRRPEGPGLEAGARLGHRP